ncbi:MAG: FadR family transcriptional regulator [Chloroflexi bacterium]|nr:FadR family transcriptional regulator [Chloroflexota bacterium]
MQAFTPVRQLRVTEDMFEQIFSRIADGSLKTGERLPTEREMALQFGVSRSTVRETLRMLQHSGLIRIKYGSQGGAFVSTDDWSPVSNALRMILRLNQTPLTELLEARKFIEAASAKLAAERAGEDDLAKMRASLEEMKANLTDHAVMNEANTLFHITIAQAAGNLVLLATMQSLQRLIEKSVDELVNDLNASHGLLSAHNEIFDAIVKRNADAAQAAMNRHLESIERQARRWLLANRASAKTVY